MSALMPRCSACVLCGEPIQGKGRIDRIYCSASCRTLAWRARSGDRWAGRRKSHPPQPGNYVARRALPLLTVRMKAELAAAKRRIVELEAQLADGGDSLTAFLVSDGVAAAGAVGLLVALKKRLGRKHRAEVERIRAAFEAEQEQQRAEQAAEREQAADRQAELERTVSALQRQHEEDAWRLRENTNDLARLRTDAAQARAEIKTRKTALLEESIRRENLQGQLARTQRQLAATQDEWQTAYRQFLAEAEQLVDQLSTDLKGWQTAYWRREDDAKSLARQLSAERADSEAATRKLKSEAHELARQLKTNPEEHRRQLAALESRAEKAEADLASLRKIQTAAAWSELDSPRQRRQTHPELPAMRRNKTLPAKEQRESKELPAQNGTAEKIVIAVVGTVAGAVATIGGINLFGDGGNKCLPPKRD